MKPLDFPLLLDENIAPDVVQGLRTRDCDLRTAWDEGLNGRPDVDVLERATGQRRVVLTHDLAFGRSAIRAGTPFVGIIYLRPGHISATFVLAVIDALRESPVETAVHCCRRTATIRGPRAGADSTAVVGTSEGVLLQTENNQDA